MAQQIPAKPSRSNGSTPPSIIAQDVKIKGNLTTSGELQLDGQVDGDVVCGDLTMGETGAVKGHVTAETVIIRGRLNGEIRGRSVRLEKTAKVEGNVWHQNISVEAGAKLSGQFIHTDNPLDKKSSEKSASSPLQGQPKTNDSAGKTESGTKAQGATVSG